MIFTTDGCSVRCTPPYSVHCNQSQLVSGSKTYSLIILVHCFHLTDLANPYSEKVYPIYKKSILLQKRELHNKKIGKQSAETSRCCRYWYSYHNGDLFGRNRLN